MEFCGAGPPENVNNTAGTFNLYIILEPRSTTTLASDQSFLSLANLLLTSRGLFAQLPLSKGSRHSDDDFVSVVDPTLTQTR